MNYSCFLAIDCPSVLPMSLFFLTTFLFDLAAPTAAPRDVAFTSVTPTSIEITWSPPDAERQNGVIVMYEIEVYHEVSGVILEKLTRSLMRANTTSWKISHLSPRTDYIFHIKAGTLGGFGPAVIVHKRSEGMYF